MKSWLAFCLAHAFPEEVVEGFSPSAADNRNEDLDGILGLAPGVIDERIRPAKVATCPVAARAQ